MPSGPFVWYLRSHMINISRKMLNTLEEAAQKAARNAYVPYSSFPVGSALLTEDGEVYVGCNVENSSFGLTNCAERSVICTAIADGRGRGDFSALLIYTPGEDCLPPCGACRQVISEFFPADALIYSSCDTGEVVAWSVEEILPEPFCLPSSQQDKEK